MALDISKLGIAGIGLDVITWLCQNIGGLAIGKNLHSHELMKGNGWRILSNRHTTFIEIDDPIQEMQFKLTWL